MRAPRGGSPSWAAPSAAPRPQTRAPTPAPCARPSRPSRWAPSSSAACCACACAAACWCASIAYDADGGGGGPTPRGASSRRSAPRRRRGATSLRLRPRRVLMRRRDSRRASWRDPAFWRRVARARASARRRRRRAGAVRQTDDAPGQSPPAVRDRRPADDSAPTPRSVLQMTTPTTPGVRARRLRDAARRRATARSTAIGPTAADRRRAARGLPAAARLYDEACWLVADFAPRRGDAGLLKDGRHLATSRSRSAWRPEPARSAAPRDRSGDAASAGPRRAGVALTDCGPTRRASGAGAPLARHGRAARPTTRGTLEPRGSTVVLLALRRREAARLGVTPAPDGPRSARRSGPRGRGRRFSGAARLRGGRRRGSRGLGDAAAAIGGAGRAALRVAASARACARPPARARSGAIVARAPERRRVAAQALPAADGRPPRPRVLHLRPRRARRGLVRIHFKVTTPGSEIRGWRVSRSSSSAQKHAYLPILHHRTIAARAPGSIASRPRAREIACGNCCHT